ncbi:MAG: ThiF family adenylyltransferase [Planctomycetaceae bacterium]|nr:ThiF family adenylyltransferase [Planctomycetaceae bacterium]
MPAQDNDSPRFDPALERYQKQILFAGIGEAGQQRLLRSSVLLVGCGALGSVIADQLGRAGVGRLRIVDRDFVETSNLQRQVLYDEQDVADQLPKAVAAARKLARINSTVRVEPVVADVNRHNVLELMRGMDIVLDGTDNFETRFLMNDAALELGVPWINGGCVGSHGQVMTIIPGRTACFRCLIPAAPQAGATETCDTAGVLASAVNVVSSLQVVDALKILTGQSALIDNVLTVVDVWDGTHRRLKLGDLSQTSGCPACQGGERAWLRGEAGSQSTILCGRNAVQLAPAGNEQLSLEELANRLRPLGAVSTNAYLVRFSVAPYEMTVFKDGRAIVKGTEDPAVARSLYARYIGH